MRPLATISLIMALVATTAVAHTAPSHSEAGLARAVLKQGKVHEKAKEWPDALAAFRIADDIMGDPDTGVSLCRVLAQIGKLLEARDVCMKVVQLPEKPREPSAMGKARDEAVELAAELELRLASVKVALQGLDAGVKPTLQIDGTSVSEGADEVIQADPGKHRIQVSAPGYVTSVEEVTLSEGQSATISVRMTRSGAGPGAAIDEQGYHWLFWAGIAATSVGVVGGTISGIFVVAENSRFRRECELAPLCGPEYKSELDRAVALAHVSTVSFVLAGLGAGAIVGGYFLTTEESAVGVWIAPNGLRLSGRF